MPTSGAIAIAPHDKAPATIVPTVEGETAGVVQIFEGRNNWVQLYNITRTGKIFFSSLIFNLLLRDHVPPSDPPRPAT